MGRITKIPVIGPIIRIGSAFFKGPKRFDYLYAQVDRLQGELDAANSRNQALQQYADGINARCERQEYMLALCRNHLRMHSRLLDHRGSEAQALSNRLGIAEDRMDEAVNDIQALTAAKEEHGDRIQALTAAKVEYDDRIQALTAAKVEHDDHIQALTAAKGEHDSCIQELLRAKAEYDMHVQKLLADVNDAERRLGEHDQHILKMLNVESDYLKTFVDRLCMEYDRLTDLNRELSIHPTVWGDAGRLHIDETAAVFPCFFNTNSGSITVGRYTFAGSRVSLLAGTHEMHLQGYLRRSAEITEGCDIVVGDGVWLASGCTLLGPCTVGDNAVIAAGAVVTPGTHVPANTIYGGVPARLIAELDFVPELDENNPYLQRVLERSDGMVLVSGWTNKTNHPGMADAGYWLEDKTGILFTNHRLWTMHYALEDADSAKLLIEGEKGTATYPIDGGIGELTIEMPAVEGEPEMLSLRLEGDAGRLFVALSVFTKG